VEKFNYKNQVIEEQALSEKSFNDIKNLVDICNKKDNTDLKFHLDGEEKSITKFLFYDEENLVAYFGIVPSYNIGTYYVWCAMNPDYRTKATFLEVFKTVKDKCDELKVDTLKFINERSATNLREFIKCIGGEKRYSTYTMKFSKECYKEDSLECKDIVLSRASLDDLNDIIQIGMEAFGTTEVDEKSYNESKLNDSKYNNFICKINNTVVGIISARIFNDEISIADLAVLKSHRKRGIARVILSKTITYFLNDEMEKFILSVETENKNALSLYEHSGFRIVTVIDCYEIKI
jgi:ribosomal protein S18 acetylase RimI-like enzyme